MRPRSVELGLFIVHARSVVGSSELVYGVQGDLVLGLAYKAGRDCGETAEHLVLVLSRWCLRLESGM